LNSFIKKAENKNFLQMKIRDKVHKQQPNEKSSGKNAVVNVAQLLD